MPSRLLLSRLLPAKPTALSTHHTRLPLSTPSPSPQTRLSSSEPHYDPPTGWLFGVPPGEKYQKEGWENVWMYGFFGSLAVGVVGWCFKEDKTIQTWALEEARRRLEAEGILPDPDSVEGSKD